MIRSLPERLKGRDRAQTRGGNLIALFVGILVAVLVGVGVVIPVTEDVIASSNVTGMAATIVGYVPELLALVLLIAVAAPLMNRF